MTANQEHFAAIEIDSIDAALSETAKRKRIPSLTLDVGGDGDDKGEKLGGNGTAKRSRPDGGSVGLSGPKPPPRPSPVTARRRPLSLEVPDYLARELKVKAATEAVTVKHLILQALADYGYEIDPSDMEEDGRRLR